MGPRGLEPRTSSLSGMRSNRAELWAPTGSQGRSIVSVVFVEPKSRGVIGVRFPAAMGVGSQGGGHWSPRPHSLAASVRKRTDMWR